MTTEAGDPALALLILIVVGWTIYQLWTGDDL